MQRREFLQVVTLGLLASQLSDGRHGEVITTKQMGELIKTLEDSNKIDSDTLIDFRQSFQDNFAFEERYLKKYGDSSNPKVGINPQYGFKPFDYEPVDIKPVIKSAEYFDTVIELYESANILLNDLLLFRTSYGDLNTELLIELNALLGHSAVARTYIIDKNGTQFKADSPDKVASLAIVLAQAETQLSDMSAFSLFEYGSIFDEIKRRQPSMLTIVANAGALNSTLDSLINGIVYGYKQASPQIVVHKNSEEFAKVSGNTSIGAFHRLLTDTIETYPKEFVLHICDLAHEYGHVLSLSRELSILEQASVARERITDMETLVNMRFQLIQKLRNLQSNLQSLNLQYTSPEITEGIKDDLMSVNVFARGIRAYLPNPIQAYLPELEETAAHLFQDIALNEYAHRNPSIGALILRLRDVRSFGQDRRHYGAYKLASELKDQFGGDSLVAFKEVFHITNADKTRDYGVAIEQYTQRMFGQSPLTETLTGIDIVVRMLAAEEKVDQLANDWSSKPTQEYKAKAERRIQDTQKRFANLFRKYLSLTLG